MPPQEKLTVSLRTPSAIPPPRLSRRQDRPRTIVPLVIFTALIGAVLWYFMPVTSTPSAQQGSGVPVANTNSANVSTNAQDAKKVADIIARVGALIELPQGETPTVATVTDPSKLKDQAFFAKAQAGDIVLMYTVAREAYLYNPDENKLVAVAPITTNAAVTTAPPKTSAAQK